VARVGEQRAPVRELDDSAKVHHRDARGDVLHHRQVVGDEDIGEAEAPLQVLQQVDDLRLDRDVERRHRLVADDQARLDRQGAGDGDALPLAAGEFVGVARGMRFCEADELQQLAHPLLFLSGMQTVKPQRLFQHRADRHARIERAVGVLEDDLHLPAQGTNFTFLEVGNFFIVEPYFPCAWLEEAQQQPADGGLAAARFADQGQRLAFGELQAHAVDRLHRQEMLDEVFRAQERAHSGALQHATKWLAVISSSCGISFLQRSTANGQRGWKRQPSGSAAASGTKPWIAASRSRSMCRRGIEPSRPIV
jgi:hypothetical protein